MPEADIDGSRRTNEGGLAPSRGPYQFRREGEYWTIHYAGSTVRLRDSRGLRHLAGLLRHSGCAVPATQLAGGGNESPVSPESPAVVPRRDVERARVNVTRAIKQALRKIGDHHAELGAHFRTTIRTGNSCSYLPDAGVPILWEL